MAYKISLPKKMMQELWMLREYCAAPSIIEQVRKSIAEYLQKKELEIGDSIESVAEAIERHEKNRPA